MTCQIKKTMFLTWSQPVAEYFPEYLWFCSKGFTFICFSIPKRTVNEHVNLLHIRSGPRSHCSCHCWSKCGRGLTVGLSLHELSVNLTTLIKLENMSCHVSYILVSCSCVSTACSKGSEMQHRIEYSRIECVLYCHYSIACTTIFHEQTSGQSAQEDWAIGDLIFYIIQYVEIFLYCMCYDQISVKRLGVQTRYEKGESWTQYNIWKHQKGAEQHSGIYNSMSLHILLTTQCSRPQVWVLSPHYDETEQGLATELQVLGNQTSPRKLWDKRL